MKRVYVKDIAKLLDEIDAIVKVGVYTTPDEGIDEEGYPAVLAKTSQIRAILLTY